MMYYYGTGMNGWGMALMGLSGLLFWCLVIAGVVLAVRYTSHTGPHGVPAGREPTPQQTLADRFARGDIDEEQYTRRLSILNGTAPTHGPGC